MGGHCPAQRMPVQRACTAHAAAPASTGPGAAHGTARAAYSGPIVALRPATMPHTVARARLLLSPRRATVGAPRPAHPPQAPRGPGAGSGRLAATLALLLLATMLLAVTAG